MENNNDYKQQALTSGAIGVGSFGIIKGLNKTNNGISNYLLHSSAQKPEEAEKNKIMKYYMGRYKNKKVFHGFVTEETLDGKPVKGIGDMNYSTTVKDEALAGNEYFKNKLKNGAATPNDKVVYVNTRAPSSVAAHEMSHAYNHMFSNNHKYYLYGKKAMLNYHKTLPIALAGGSLVKDKDTRHKTNYALAGLTSATMLPTFLEETKANLQANKVLKDLKINRLKGGNLRALIGSQLSYTLPVVTPFVAAAIANKTSDYIYKQ